MTLDQNIITWAIIIPFSGKTYAFKKALRYGDVARKNQIWAHFPNIDKAKSFVKNL